MLIHTLAVGLAVGLLMGVLGGGGGVLTVPILVYLLGEPAQQATTGSLVIVGVTALAGAVSRWRSGGVCLRSGVTFGVLGIPAALAGTAVNHRLDPAALLLAFAALILVVAAALLAGTRRRPDPDRTPARAGGTAVAVRVRPSAAVSTALTVVPSALVIGFLTGLLGVGGGFLLVPALVILLRMPMTSAIGTSLLVIAINSAASLAARAGMAEFDWSVVVPFTLAAVVATTFGKRVADRLSGDALTRAFAVLLIAVAGFVSVQSLTAF